MLYFAQRSHPLYLSFRYTELTSIEKMNFIIPTANLPSDYAWDWKDECQEDVLFRLQIYSATPTLQTLPAIQPTVPERFRSITF